jgi:hypothetical protein
MSSSRYCIVVVTYERLASLTLLLDSLLLADYDGQKVDLVISIDNGPAEESIKQFADSFDWPYGNKETRTFSANLGLRQHILQCGAIVEKYEAIFLFEDDLIAGSNFFRFGAAAIEKYGNDKRVAGISLYAPTFNEMACLPFEPDTSGYDAYFLQSTQSWGQCWTKSMWNGFATWYQHNSAKLINEYDMPDRIYSWPESSWKKYAMKYLATNNLTWVYPYISHSTNSSQIGTHNKVNTSLFQTVLSQGAKKFKLPSWQDVIKYDIYFERILDANDGSNMGYDNIVFDIYGTRQLVEGFDYIATSRILDRPIVSEYNLDLKPHEINILRKNQGFGLGVYRLNKAEKLKLRQFPSNRHAAYYSNLIWQDSLIAGIKGLLQAVKLKIGRFLGFR